MLVFRIYEVQAMMMTEATNIMCFCFLYEGMIFQVFYGILSCLRPSSVTLKTHEISRCDEIYKYWSWPEKDGDCMRTTIRS